ncbi:hypothetical protein Q664_00155 [Archangium violaceum Cb vi76]|uniref:eCIS core domain-containing protein n=1 Tax=Archangium violaceum Cb vi76 TaxID=1406225 RepID=A0A084T284_9BACT|nr:hypothetical protein Q664_00155 [Archangium violaceum Cb vi76]
MGTSLSLAPAEEHALAQARGSGIPLKEELRHSMEQALSTPLGDVSLHTDDRADALARSLSARAFTLGRHVFFRRGALEPATRRGRELLAHELTHVAQQAGAAGGTDSSAGGGLVQRMFVKDTGEQYKNHKRAHWYSSLDAEERAVADEMHLNKGTRHKASDAKKAVQKEVARRKGAAGSTAVAGPSSGTPVSASSPGAAFSGGLGYDSGVYDVRHVSEDFKKTGPKPSVSAVNAFYSGMLLKSLNEAKERDLKALDVDSSDSEAEVGQDPARQKVRRRYKAKQLSALTRTLFPLTPGEMQVREVLGQKRKRDNEANSDYQIYEQDTREGFAQVGEQFKQTNVRHNPYLRRAFRKAVAQGDVKKGGSETYEKIQGRIRTKLLGIISSDHEKMTWRREDFADEQTWKAFGFLRENVISNSAVGDSYYSRVESGADTKGSSGRMAFHHGAWKESMGGIFLPFATMPSNLIALNDFRELLNPKKLKLLEAQGKSPPPAGAHDLFGHQACGFRKDQRKDFSRSRGGGQFKDIDLEAVYYVLRPSLEPRTPKKLLYSASDSTSSAMSNKKRKKGG